MQLQDAENITDIQPGVFEAMDHLYSGSDRKEFISNL